jgi:hypothetical protein
MPLTPPRERRMESQAGCVYALVNEHMPGLVKIGFTSGSADERARELARATGVPGTFSVAHQEVTSNARLAELTIHVRLRASRKSKEFFEIDIDDAISVITAVCEEIGKDDDQVAGHPIAEQAEAALGRRAYDAPEPRPERAMVCFDCKASFRIPIGVQIRRVFCPECGWSAAVRFDSERDLT